MLKVPSFYDFLFPSSDNHAPKIAPVNRVQVDRQLPNGVRQNKKMYDDLSKQLGVIFIQMRKLTEREQLLRAELNQTKKNADKSKQTISNSKELVDAFRQLRGRIVEVYSTLQDHPEKQTEFIQKINDNISDNKHIYIDSGLNKNRVNFTGAYDSNVNSANKTITPEHVSEHEKTINNNTGKNIDPLVVDRLILILNGIHVYLSPELDGIRGIANLKARRLQDDARVLHEILRKRGISINKFNKVKPLNFTTPADFIRFAYKDLDEIITLKVVDTQKDIETKLYGMRAGIKKMGEILNRQAKANNHTSAVVDARNNHVSSTTPGEHRNMPANNHAAAVVDARNNRVSRTTPGEHRNMPANNHAAAVVDVGKYENTGNMRNFKKSTSEQNNIIRYGSINNTNKNVTDNVSGSPSSNKASNLFQSTRSHDQDKNIQMSDFQVSSHI